MAFAVEGDGVGFATESYAASALYTTLASLSGALWRIRRASYRMPRNCVCPQNGKTGKIERDLNLDFESEGSGVRFSERASKIKDLARRISLEFALSNISLIPH